LENEILVFLKMN